MLNSSDEEFTYSSPGSMTLSPPTSLYLTNSRDQDEEAVASDLDIDKPASLSSRSLNQPVSRARSRSTSATRRGSSKLRPRRNSRHRDELTTMAKVFKDLLIMEETIRQQLQQQKFLRRKYTLFCSLLCGLIAFCIYQLYFSNTDQLPTGFWLITYQFLSIITTITLVLFYLSGEYHRTIVLPKKFLITTNKGLRQLNLRAVRVKAPWGDVLSDISRFVLRLLYNTIKFVYKGTSESQWCQELYLRSQERIGATEIKLVLNSRSFSPAVRESWELYRNEFWAREGARRRSSIRGPVGTTRKARMKTSAPS
ncbi:Putative Nem1p-Spo7p phosphatase holoenzyme regulatory subunit [Komagataella phaffii CBS 7435]|uniref:Regulatory subunit of Nem1p-Spo7p phosphatase holoenzyme n=2 Tax=Komagataella phaffii TaxID=460519 RepID=C4QWJ5_KOMPG|nr:Regulatory subunit of Nem1p-Spo7p phosphatase holoenzyme [Komagataella phaffii GS115]AOA61300.1 GQ67_02829T0 [Komagataella phaffii]CAH2446317.1 Putative Nem1p-Spo7p phosphatase holoenzyme regulatory subunit [Komagataella phaffii CBS 7435]AOA66180.1 GQ68_02418T0 [Komagataella phaffii GS115]CAY67618.1 Regulatory subunit of Nem1p-Spo7p phosphatase holoenzyme [Komagataella phaffii GS115]CCA36710.1 Putative Nem1p-Spo7p phosphatase holoenzyme regulatory subunit [Komagataella phaffii CBS 7435]